MQVYIILAVLVALGGTHTWAYRAGGENRENALRVAQQKEKDKRAKKGNDAAANLETENAEAKQGFQVVTEYVDRFIDRPVYRNVCFDDDGLRAANAGLAGALAAKPDQPVSAAEAAGGRKKRNSPS